MPLDAKLWDDLQQHGVNDAQLRMLLRLLKVQRNGSWSWHYVHGHITDCEARLRFPGKDYEVSRTADIMLEGDTTVSR